MENPRLTKTEEIVLRCFTEGAEYFGLQLVEQSKGKILRGSVYVVLQSLERAGLLWSREIDRTPPEIGIPRRLYKITPGGIRVIRALDAFYRVLNEE